MIISKKVQEALEKGFPVVALETTIISHGMPYPKNVECALQVENVIIENGAIPATIGIINGEPVIGMSHEEIELFGKKEGIRKVSRRDLAICIANKEWGATTVSATMLLAKKAGIQFFVTGGIGGAQKGAEKTYDISADLEELAKTDVTVICAGPKAILDLNITAEILETKGVPIIGYNTDKMPAFFTPTSNINVDFNAKSPLEIANIIYTKNNMNLEGGVLVTVPVPKEFAMDEKVINSAINDAQKEMEKKGIKGKDETPFLLKKINEITEGKSLETNIYLIKNNAKIGAKIAVEYSKLIKGE